MQKRSDGLQRTVPEIFEGVVVPEAGHLNDRGPQAILSLRGQISRTLDRLVRAGENLGDGPAVRG